MVTIVPTLLCKNSDELLSEITLWENKVSLVQIDFADGIFVENTLPGPEVLQGVSTSLQFECHLMVEEPDDWVDQLLEIPQVKTIIVHVESEVVIKNIADKIHHAGKLFGIALEPDTEATALEPYWELIDQIVVLCVEPGFNGSPFLPEAITTVRDIRKLWPTGVIETDGGMNLQTGPLAVKAGANQVAVGSYFKDDLSKTDTRLQDMQEVVGA